MKSQETTEIADSPNDFYQLYSKVRALCQEAEKDNEAVGLFLTSKLDLDRAIDSGDKNLANLHALQGLLHWLQPSYPEFDRMENAQAMQSHASSAVKLSEARKQRLHRLLRRRTLRPAENLFFPYEVEPLGFRAAV